jgi:hypothetical protein
MTTSGKNKPAAAKRKNIYEMYIENGCRFGFYVTRDSWREDRYAQVIGIDGVIDGEMIEGNPPYFNRVYPDNHPATGKTWQRGITFKADWLDGGISHASTGGTYTFTRVHPDNS